MTANLRLGFDRAKKALPNLTPRQREVFDLLACGYSCAQISRRLGIVPSSVNHMRERVLDALGLFNSAQIVLLADEVRREGKV